MGLLEDWKNQRKQRNLRMMSNKQVQDGQMQAKLQELNCKFQKAEENVLGLQVIHDLCLG